MRTWVLIAVVTAVVVGTAIGFAVTRDPMRSHGLVIVDVRDPITGKHSSVRSLAEPAVRDGRWQYRDVDTGCWRDVPPEIAGWEYAGEAERSARELEERRGQ